MGASTAIDACTAVSALCVVMGLLISLLDGRLEGRQGSVPELVEVHTQSIHPGRVELIDATGTNGQVDNEPCVLEHLQVLGDRRPADWQLARQLTDRAWTIGQPLEDLPSRRIG